MIISMIAAVANNGVIGKDNDLVWHLPDDMKFFMETTINHFVIMGRKNFESIPDKYRPLPKRTNIIVTRQLDFLPEDCVVVNNIEKALKYAEELNQTEIFIIGGGQIYEQSIVSADKLYITEVKENFDGDTYFPAIEQSVWHEESRVNHPIDSRHKYEFDFVVYSRKIKE